MIMMMKKQQWMFKHVFSMINYSLSSSSSISFNNNNVLRRRPFCCSTTTPLSTKLYEFSELLENKLPLLIVPYDHITPKEYVLRPPKKTFGGDYNVCDGTFGFINLFFHDDADDDDQLIIKKKKKKKKKGVYDVYLPAIAKRHICGSSEGWLATVHLNGEFQLLNPVTRDIVHLPPFTTVTVLGCFHLRYPSYIIKVVTNTIITTTTNSTTTLPPAAEDTMMVMAIHGQNSSDGCLVFCRTSSTDETTAAAAAWIEIPIKVPMSAVNLYLHNHGYPVTDTDDTDTDTDTDSDDTDTDTEHPEHSEVVTYEVIDGVSHWVSTYMTQWSDVTFYKGNFYAVSGLGTVGVVKGLDGPSPFVQFLIHDPPSENHQSSDDINNISHELCYLVESSSSSSSGGGGDLLMVMRKTMRNIVSKQGVEEEEEEEEEEEDIFERPYSTNGFRVLKLDLNGPTWEEVTDLGEDCALFVGRNHSFSFSASKIPGCRGNCIYFTDHQDGYSYPNAGHDVGVYYLEDASFEKLNYETCSSQLIMPPPIWYDLAAAWRNDFVHQRLALVHNTNRL